MTACLKKENKSMLAIYGTSADGTVWINIYITGKLGYSLLWDEWGLNSRNCYRLKESTVREETAESLPQVPYQLRGDYL